MDSEVLALLTGIGESLSEVIARLDSVGKRLDAVEARLGDVEKQGQALNQSMASMEYDYGRKLDALFDAFELNRIYHVDNNDKLSTLEETAASNSLRISVLEMR